MSTHRRGSGIFRVILWLLTVSLTAHAQRTQIQMFEQPYPFHSGVWTNVAGPDIVIRTEVLAREDFTNVRLHFTSHNLGSQSYVRITSAKDQRRQTLTRERMALWSDTSASFNGAVLEVELVVVAGDSGIFFEVDKVLGRCSCGEEALLRMTSGGIQSLCGEDNRVASSDNRVGRLGGGCTGWLVSNGAVLTAGHCAPLSGAFEVNIPPSDSNGSTVDSDPARDMYPILGGSTVFDTGDGKDWAVFRIGPNELGESAHIRHGFFRMTRDIPLPGATLRVTGCGVDNTPNGTGRACCNRNDQGDCTHFSCNAQSQTLQTSTGELITGLANHMILHNVDTEPGNSGGPIIREGTSFTIGIHDAGGCEFAGNSGTSFQNGDLEAALQNFASASTVFVDTLVYPNAPSPKEDGTIFHPFDSVGEAYAAAGSGDLLSIVEGSYDEQLVLRKKMVLKAPVGNVVIGK